MISEKKLALMQGRLTKPIRKPIQEFPIENWENEIGLLNKLNFKAIEWIIDLYSYEKNPILASRDLVNDILNKNKIKISAISNDYFLDLGNQIGQISFKQMCEIIKRQEDLIFKLGNNQKCILVMPFIESCSLKKFSAKEIDKIFSLLLSLESSNNIDFALELDINCNEIDKKLADILETNVFINLDMGNTISYGFNIDEEIENYSSQIINVHIKDRRINGPTVPLGKGDTNVEYIINKLYSCGYKGSFTLQLAREDRDEEITVRSYLKEIVNYE